MSRGGMFVWKMMILQGKANAAASSASDQVGTYEAYGDLIEF